MTAATKSGGTAGTIPGDYRLTHSRELRTYKSAKPVAGRPATPAIEPSRPEHDMRQVGHLSIHRILRVGERSVIGRTVIRGGTYQLIEIPAPVTPPPPPDRRPSPGQLARQLLTAKAFTMHLEHLNFLKRVSTGESPPITPETALRASKAWRLLWKASDFKIPVPSAGTGPDGEMFYAWNAGRHHLELEIIPGQPAEFFYRDRESGEFWGEDYETDKPLPAGVVSKLALFR